MEVYAMTLEVKREFGKLVYCIPKGRVERVMRDSSGELTDEMRRLRIEIACLVKAFMARMDNNNPTLKFWGKDSGAKIALTPCAITVGETRLLEAGGRLSGMHQVSYHEPNLQDALVDFLAQQRVLVRYAYGDLLLMWDDYLPVVYFEYFKRNR